MGIIELMDDNVDIAEPLLNIYIVLKGGRDAMLIESTN